MPYERKMSPTEVKVCGGKEELSHWDLLIPHTPRLPIPFVIMEQKKRAEPNGEKKKNWKTSLKENNINGTILRKKIDFKEKMYSIAKEEQFTMVHVSLAKTISACGNKKPKFT